MSIAIPTTGIEYTIVPDGNVLTPSAGGQVYPGSDEPYTWSSTNISYASCVPINGYEVQMKYRIVTPTTTLPVGTPGQPGYIPGSTTYTIGYGLLEVISQTLTCVSHAVATPGNPMQQLDPYFTSAPGTYSTVTVGLVDGSCYDYFKVFDQGGSGYLERLGPYNSTPISGQVIPSTPYDPSNDIYPIDALTEFVRDYRESGNVTYELSTTYRSGTTIGGVTGPEVTETITINHTVTQNTDDWSAQVQSLRSNSHFYHGYRPLMPDPRT